MAKQEVVLVVIGLFDTFAAEIMSVACAWCVTCQCIYMHKCKYSIRDELEKANVAYVHDIWHTYAKS